MPRTYIASADSCLSRDGDPFLVIQRAAGVNPGTAANFVRALPDFIADVRATLDALRLQPFAVQVACKLDALEASLVILDGEG